MQDSATNYKKITNAGSFAFWLGVLELVLIPLIIYIVYANVQIEQDHKVTTVLINGSYQLVLGVVLIFFGRRLRKTIPGDPQSLDQADQSRKALLWLVAIGLLIAIATGGRAGILIFLLLANLIWTGKAIKQLRSEQAAPLVSGSVPSINPVDPPTTPPQS